MRKYFVLLLLMSPLLMGFELDENLNCPHRISNSRECAEYLENRIIHTLNFAKREGDILRISTGSGKILKLENTKTPEESSCFHYLVDFISDIAMVVIFCQYWEGGTFYAIHLTNGKMMEIKGYPNLSPNRKQFVTATIDLMAGYTSNTINIYQISKQGYRLVWSIEPEGWGAKNLKWENDNVIGFNKTTLNSSYKYKKVPAMITRVKGKWQLKMN